MKKAIVLLILLLSAEMVFCQSVLDTAIRDSLLKTEWLEGQSSPGVYEVSIIQLISGPTTFDQKRVMVSGYLHISFENVAIYLSSDDFKHGISKNAIWIEFNDYVRQNIDIKKFTDQYVTLIGSYNSSSKGHEGVYSGTMEEVYSLWVK